MRTEEILEIEKNNDGSVINLVQDRLFWQAWEQSSFLLTRHLKNYQINKRHVKKVMRDFVFCGFPKTALEEFKKNCIDKGLVFEQVSLDRICIRNLPKIQGYEEWKKNILETPEIKSEVKPKKNDSPYLAAAKISFDLAIHIQRATVKMHKEFRYELGARVRAYSTDIAENLHLLANKVKLQNDVVKCRELLYRLRLDLRILQEIKQISFESWMNLNSQIEKLLNLLKVESYVSNSDHRRDPNQSGNPL